MNRVAVLVGMVVMMSASPALAQSDLDARLKSLSSLAQTDAEYRLGPGDLIEVGVFGVDDFRHTVRISASGLIKLPLLDPIPASGLTPAQLEVQLTASLRDDVIKNPQVSVFVKEYRSQPVVVLGAVKTPGQYQITTQLKIVDAISMAGGLQSNAVDEAVIQRPLAQGGEEIIKVNLQKLLEEGDLALNLVVRGGDVIHIKERLTANVFILGEVNRAGAFEIPAKQDLRITQVFAWAGGPMKTAKLSKGVLLRYDDKGQRQELPINFNDILKGKKEDFVVRANDIIFVPGSKFRDLGYSLLQGIPGTLASLPFRIP